MAKVLLETVEVLPEKPDRYETRHGLAILACVGRGGARPGNRGRIRQLTDSDLRGRLPKVR